MKKTHGKNGFTLVEVIVVGVIGAILAGLFISFMRVHNATLNEGVARAKMQMQSDLVSDRMARMIRSANAALAADEVWSPNIVLASRNQTSIVLYSDAGVVQYAYGIAGSPRRMLMEGSAANAMHVLTSGNDTVYVDSGSRFMLSPDRKGVALSLSIITTYRNKDYRIPAKRDMYLCRN